jgi:hypothetical protein
MKRPEGAISYAEWLRGLIAEPGKVCGPDVVDDRSWWQHLPGLNPHAGLERQARAASRQADREAGS